MYHVSLGQYKINNNEILPTQNLDEGIHVLFDYEENKLYSLLLVDEGSLDDLDTVDTLDIGDTFSREMDNSPYIHLFITNISNGEVYIPDMYSSYQEFHIVENYEKPLKYNSPHLFSLYLYIQDCDRSYPLIQKRENFDLEELIQREENKGCLLSQVDKISFYAVADISSIDEYENEPQEVYVDSEEDMNDHIQENKRNFEDMYPNTNEWNEEDYEIIAKSVFGILNTEDLSKEEIKNKIIKFFK